MGLVSRFPLPFAVCLLLAAVAAFGLGANGTALAATPQLVVEDISAESKFPDGINFRVRVDHPRDVKSITVTFTLVGPKRPVPQYSHLPLPETASGVSEAMYRTGERYIPPGVLMDYYFDVEDTAGNVVRSRAGRFVYDDPRFTWQEIQKDSLTIRYYGPVQRRAETVVDAVNSTVDRIGRRLFGLTEVSPVRLTLYNNWRDMVTALPPTSRTQRGELITEGTTFSNFNTILLLSDDSSVRGLASHEMVHFLLSDALGPARIPVWMNEGLAEYGNVEPSQVYEQYLSLAIVRGTMKPLASLESMPGLSEDVIVVYGQGRSVVEYMIEVEPDGAAKLRKLLGLMREHNSFGTALQQSYGFDLFELDQRWRKSIGAPQLSRDISGTAQPKAPTLTVAPLPFPTPSQSAPAPSATSPSTAESAAPSPDRPRREGGGGACSRGDAAAMDLGMWLGLAGVLALVLATRRRT